MRLKFYAVLHYMHLDSVKNNGKRININGYKGRITNNNQQFEKELTKPNVYERIGHFSASEFMDNHATYIYLNIDEKHITTDEEMDKEGLGLAFELLRGILYFIHYLWGVKDNNVYVRDGFLISEEGNDTEEGAVYKASLSAINSTADLSNEYISVFSDQEIEKAQSMLDSKLFELELDGDEDLSREMWASKYATQGLFDKKRGSTRYGRAFLFVLMARSSGILPLKIVSYVNALECLFTTTKAELTHRLSERAAFFLEKEPEKRMALYKKIKKAYSLRSTIVHGEHIKEKEEVLIELSVELDKILRKLLVEYKEFYLEHNDNQINEYFDKLTLGLLENL